MLKGNVDDILKEKLNEINEKKYINIELLEENKPKINFKLVASFAILFLLVLFSTIYFNINSDRIDNTIAKDDNDIIVSEDTIISETEQNNTSEEINNKEPETATNTNEEVEQSNNNNNNNNNITNIPSDNDNLENNQNIPVQTVEIENASYGTIGSTQYILVIKIDSIENSTNFSTKTDSHSYTITNLKATVIKDLKGNYNKNSVNFYTYGGKIKISDYEAVLLPEEIKKLGFDTKSKTEKQNSYINIIPNKNLGIAQAEVGNTYLVSLTYDNIFYDSLAVVSREEYNFKLYDINTNKYKNTSGTWNEVQI